MKKTLTVNYTGILIMFLVSIISLFLPVSLCVRGRYLALLYRGIMFVTHGTDLHAFVPLSVSLGEKLHHDAVCPSAVKLQRFGWVAQVSTVDHILQNLKERRSVRHTWCWISF